MPRMSEAEQIQVGASISAPLDASLSQVIVKLDVLIAGQQRMVGLWLVNLVFPLGTSFGKFPWEGFEFRLPIEFFATSDRDMSKKNERVAGVSLNKEEI